MTLYRSHAIFEEDLARLGSSNYQIARLDAHRCISSDRFHDDVSAPLSFPAHYGRNPHALADCLSDVAVQEYGWEPEATGLVTAISSYRAFTQLFPELARLTLNVIAGASRQALLFGGRLLCLVQADNSRAHYDPVGATPTQWNPRESLDARRQPSPS